MSDATPVTAAHLAAFMKATAATFEAIIRAGAVDRAAVVEFLQRLDDSLPADKVNDSYRTFLRGYRQFVEIGGRRPPSVRH